MDELFSKYERELVNLRGLCREYAQRYPKVAARLELGGETCEDPHVERLIEAVALLCARVTKRLDDQYPQFTEALLNLLFPHYLRPFPSCAIAYFAPSASASEVPRGTRLESLPIQGVPCTFTTAYAVSAATSVLTNATFSPLIDAPPSVRIPVEVGAAISLTLAPAQPAAQWTERAGEQRRIRLYIDGEASFCAALRDALFAHGACAYLQCGKDASWIALPSLPLAQVGFADEEALIPFDARSHVAYRVLTEYFAFPEKFNFFDIDLDRILKCAPAAAGPLTLHIGISDIRADSDRARLLATLSPDNLRQGCTPVVNLFRQPGVPITFDQRSADYSVLAHGSRPQAFEVYAVEQVNMLQQNGREMTARPFAPFYSLGHGAQNGGPGRYWLLRRDETLAACSPGHEAILTLVDAHCDALDIDQRVLSVELQCTNRDLPCTLPMDAGKGDGDLFFIGAKGGSSIRFLRRPSRPLRLVNSPDTQWRLVSHLALNHNSMVQSSAALREILTLYNLAESPVARRQVSAIVEVTKQDATAWIRNKRGASLVHGTEVIITIDEDAFIGNGLHLFTQVLEQFFGMAAHINSFVELVILSRQSGKELLRCEPRSGIMSLM